MPLIDYFSTPSKRFYFVYLLSAGLIALVYWKLRRQKITLAEAKAYWLHPSALLDYSYFVIGGLVKIHLVVPLIVSAQNVMLWVNRQCLETFGYVSLPQVGQGAVTLLYTVVLFVASDFSRYWVHRAMHAVPFLWSFHKVHHSAEVLNPFTFYRVHPVENFLFGLRYAVVVGGVTGLFIYLFGAKVQLYNVLGANIFLFVFNFIGGNLRHSHIALGYPKILEYFFISPRQHQLHHSYHFTRCNYGGYLAVWDTMFSTLKTTTEVKPATFGLGARENIRYGSLLALFVSPFYEVIKRWQKKIIKRSILDQD